VSITKKILLILMTLASVAPGNAQAQAGYQYDYNVQHVNVRSEKTGEMIPVVTFTSALDGKSYFISEGEFREAQRDGVVLANYLIERARQDYPPTSLDESRAIAAMSAVKIYGSEAKDAPYVKFYVDLAISMADAEMKVFTATGTTDEVGRRRPNNVEASAAMDRLQDAKGKPHVKGGVRYDVRTDTYNWVGPKFGRQMSEQGDQFLSEVGPYLEPGWGQIETTGVPPSISKSDATANAARIEAERKAKAAAGPTKEELESAAHDAEIRANNERALKAASNVSYGLTIEQITAAKSSIVSIIEENTKTGDQWEGTGWFIDGNRIVTNDTVVNYQEEHYDRTTIVNIGTGEHYTFNRIIYEDSASNIAIILIKELNSTHLNLSKVEPVKGMEVTIIGNPKHVRGTVTTGKITDVKDLGEYGWINAIHLDAGLQEGDGGSGSPVLDSDGNVLGMVWGAKANGSGSGVAVTAKTLKLIAAHAALEFAAPRAELVVVRRAERVLPRAPTSVANTRDYNNWTTERLKLIFIPPTRITRVHGKIKTVTFLYPPDARGSAVNAYQCFHLIFMFLFGPKEESNPHMHNLEDGPTPGGLSMKDPETGYVVTRDRDPHYDIRDMDPNDMGPNDGWRYYFTVTKNDTAILTAILVEPEQETLGPRFVLHIN
jgi:S1-C subfamily serine protease